MKTSELDYTLPSRYIAQEPLPHRESSRLLILDRERNTIKENVFTGIGDFITAGDCLVLNNTKVIPARVFGRKTTGARIEFLFVKELSAGTWEVLIRPARRIRKGSSILFGNDWYVFARFLLLAEFQAFVALTDGFCSPAGRPVRLLSKYHSGLYVLADARLVSRCLAKAH
ncbi:MAG: S-adenosylmethionine:tRNA ribosyltransferase-isomerase [Candidatus Omnitrophota bacterium]